MIKKDLNNVLEALKSIKMPKVENKDLRTALIKTHFVLLGEQKRFVAAVEDLRTVYLGAYQDEIAELAPMEEEMMNPATPDGRKLEIAKVLRSHTDLQAAIKTFNAECNKLAGDTVEVEPIDSTAFLAMAMEQGIELETIEKLYPILSENGLD